jgi:hypothetical protein
MMMKKRRREGPRSSADGQEEKEMQNADNRKNKQRNNTMEISNGVINTRHPSLEKFMFCWGSRTRMASGWREV